MSSNPAAQDPQPTGSSSQVPRKMLVYLALVTYLSWTQSMTCDTEPSGKEAAPTAQALLGER